MDRIFNPVLISARRSSLHRRRRSVPLLSSVRGDQDTPAANHDDLDHGRNNNSARGRSRSVLARLWAALPWSSSSSLSSSLQYQPLHRPSTPAPAPAPAPEPAPVTSSHRHHQYGRWGFRRIMLQKIPSNWAELCGYLMLMTITNIVYRAIIIAVRYPRDQDVWTTAKTINNYQMLLHYCSTSYMLGTIALTDVCTVFYLVFMLASSAIFTYLGTLSFFHNSISPSSIPHWSPLAIAGYSLAFSVMLMSLIYQGLIACQHSKAYFTLYLGSLLTTLILHVVLFLTLEDGVHLHHWYICWVFMQFVRARTRISVMCHAVACGVFQQGMAAYGPAPVLYDPALSG